MLAHVVLLASVLAVALALPVEDPVLRKLDEQRYGYLRDATGDAHLVDLWVKASDLQQAARFEPDTQNVYHLFTRENPTVSQPLLLGNAALLGAANFRPQCRTVVLIHGWLSDVTSNINSVLVPAFLSAEDVNVIVADWSAGAGTISYAAAVINTRTSGESVARFISWLNAATGASVADYHIVGHSLGGQQVGVVGRNLGGQVSYITSLDPPFLGYITNEHTLRATDGVYTEVIYTSALGYLSLLGDVNFYPNGGFGMPGCNSQECDHDRCIFYLGESVTSGGFTGSRCDSLDSVFTGDCDPGDTLRMGGLVPKTGSSGMFYLETNAAPPFSRG